MDAISSFASKARGVILLVILFSALSALMTEAYVLCFRRWTNNLDMSFRGVSFFVCFLSIWLGLDNYTLGVDLADARKKICENQRARQEQLSQTLYSGAGVLSVGEILSTTVSTFSLREQFLNRMIQSENDRHMETAKTLDRYVLLNARLRDMLFRAKGVNEALVERIVLSSRTCMPANVFFWRVVADRLRVRYYRALHKMEKKKYRFLLRATSWPKSFDRVTRSEDLRPVRSNLCPPLHAEI